MQLFGFQVYYSREIVEIIPTLDFQSKLILETTAHICRMLTCRPSLNCIIYIK